MYITKSYICIYINIYVNKSLITLSYVCARAFVEDYFTLYSSIFNDLNYLYLDTFIEHSEWILYLHYGIHCKQDQSTKRETWNVKEKNNEKKSINVETMF